MLAAESAQTFGIKVYTIGTISLSSTDQFDEGLLREIAAKTGGEYFRAYDASGLNEIYERINKMEKTQFSPTMTVNYKDRYAPPLALALILLCLSFLLDKLVFVRLP